MAFLGDWQITQTLTLYVQTINPDTGAAWAADAFPTYRLYHMPTGTPIATGTYAPLAAAGATGLYAVQVPLTIAAGFVAGGTYGVRTAVTIVGATEALEDQFSITLNPHTIVPARLVWRGSSSATRQVVTITPARLRWQAIGRAPRTLTLIPAQLRWAPQAMFPRVGFPRAALVWAARPMRISQDFPFRETTPALTFLP